MKLSLLPSVTLPLLLAILPNNAGAVPLISNGSFEAHGTFTGFDSTFSYLSGLNNSWDYGTGGGGIASVGAFGTMANRDLNTWGLLQGAGAVSQTFAGLANSIVSYSFVGQGRDNNGGAGVLLAFIDGILLSSTVTSSNTPFTVSGTATLNSFSTHTFSFAWTPNSGDNTVFFDNVQIDGSLPVPEISTSTAALPLFLSIGLLVVSRKRRSENG